MFRARTLKRPLLREMEKNKGARSQLQGRDASGGSAKRPPEASPPPKLSDLGITRPAKLNLVQPIQNNSHGFVDFADEIAGPRLNLHWTKKNPPTAEASGGGSDGGKDVAPLGG